MSRKKILKKIEKALLNTFTLYFFLFSISSISSYIEVSKLSYDSYNDNQTLNNTSNKTFNSPIIKFQDERLNLILAHVILPTINGLLQLYYFYKTTKSEKNNHDQLTCLAIQNSFAAINSLCFNSIPYALNSAVLSFDSYLALIINNIDDNKKTLKIKNKKITNFLKKIIKTSVIISPLLFLELIQSMTLFLTQEGLKDFEFLSTEKRIIEQMLCNKNNEGILCLKNPYINFDRTAIFSMLMSSAFASYSTLIPFFKILKQKCQSSYNTYQHPNHSQNNIIFIQRINDVSAILLIPNHFITLWFNVTSGAISSVANIFLSKNKNNGFEIVETDEIIDPKEKPITP